MSIARPGLPDRAAIGSPRGDGGLADRVRAIVFGLFVVVLIVAGGDATAPASVMVVQLAAIVALGVTLTLRWGRPEPFARAAIGLLVLAALVPLAQLVPLPGAVWAGLPGRALAVQILTAVDAAGAARPLTIDPDSTRQAALAFLPLAAAFLGMLRATYPERYRITIVLIALALADLALGALQFATRGNPAFLLHDTPHRLAAVGFFANRNHNSDLMLIAPMLAAAILRWDPWDRFARVALPAALGLLAVFTIGVVIASSRMGLLLLLVAVPATLGLSVRRVDLRRGALIGAGTLLVVLVLAILILTNPVVAGVFDRFNGTGSEGRFQFWPDVIYAIRQYLPWGSGAGTFDPVFRSIEQLDFLTPYYINHAHDDYLEVALEAGVPGIVLMLAGLALFGVAALRHLRAIAARRADPVALAALASIAVLLLHALVDYPLRTPALAGLFGMLCAMLFRPPAPNRTI